MIDYRVKCTSYHYLFNGDNQGKWCACIDLYCLSALVLNLYRIFLNISRKVKEKALSMETKLYYQAVTILKPHQIRFCHTVWELLC
jgi:hypothetical protein